MAKLFLTDEFWAVIAPLLPPERPKPKGGRPRIDDCKALTAILFMLKSAIPWEMLRRDGLRLGHDVLASHAGLAEGRRLCG